MNSLKFDRELDARGLESPMPVVKAREVVSTMSRGQVLKVTATDDHSVHDFQGWTRSDKEIDLVATGAECNGSGRTVFVLYVEVK